jgi:hypothetical protein
MRYRSSESALRRRSASGSKAHRLADRGLPMPLQQQACLRLRLSRQGEPQVRAASQQRRPRLQYRLFLFGQTQTESPLTNPGRYPDRVDAWVQTAIGIHA